MWWHQVEAPSLIWNPMMPGWFTDQYGLKWIASHNLFSHSDVLHFTKTNSNQHCSYPKTSLILCYSPVMRTNIKVSGEAFLSATHDRHTLWSTCQTPLGSGVWGGEGCHSGLPASVREEKAENRTKLPQMPPSHLLRTLVRVFPLSSSLFLLPPQTCWVQLESCLCATPTPTPQYEDGKDLQSTSYQLTLPTHLKSGAPQMRGQATCSVDLIPSPIT